MVACAADAQWMHSGCAVDAQRMRSGRAALRLLWLKQKKTSVPMTPPQNCPKILLTPHHLHLREFCVKLGRNRGNCPNFAPVAFLVGTNNPGDPPPNVRRFMLPILTSDHDGFRRRQSVASSCSCCPPPKVAKQRRDRPPSQR
jgi:hypothetical protein